jgi:hypothetical protein
MLFIPALWRIKMYDLSFVVTVTFVYEAVLVRSTSYFSSVLASAVQFASAAAKLSHTNRRATRKYILTIFIAVFLTILRTVRAKPGRARGTNHAIKDPGSVNANRERTLLTLPSFSPSEVERD